MIMDDENFIKISQLTISNSYNQNYKPFIKTLILTRLPFLKRNELFMRGIQIGMLDSLSKMQDNLREFNSKLSSSLSALETKNLEKNILIQNEWIRTIQTIADGIAWRSFNFDRPILRHLSDNKSPGHISQLGQGFDYLETLKKFLRTFNGFPIVNDLTRILRIGDFTVFYPQNKQMIYEIKEKGKKIFNVGQIFYEIKRSKKIPNPQKWRQLTAQMSIIERKVRLITKKDGSVQDNFEVDIVDLKFPIKNHFRKLKKLIRVADREGIAAMTVEDGYFIQVVAVDKMKNEKIAQHVSAKFKTNYPKWVKNNPNIFSLTNYDSFYQEGGEFTRNIIPYSVLPLSARNCVRLMMGHLWITVIIDTSIIKKKLLKLNWKVSEGEIPDQLPAGATLKQKVDSEKFFEIKKDDENGTFTSNLTISEIMIALSSFYSFDFLIDSLEFSYHEARRTKRSGYVTKNYLGEQKLLI